MDVRMSKVAQEGWGKEKKKEKMLRTEHTVRAHSHARNVLQ